MEVLINEIKDCPLEVTVYQVDGSLKVLHQYTGSVLFNTCREEKVDNYFISQHNTLYYIISSHHITSSHYISSHTRLHHLITSDCIITPLRPVNRENDHILTHSLFSTPFTLPPSLPSPSPSHPLFLTSLTPFISPLRSPLPPVTHSA